jgi:hypothetical protein
MMSALMATGAHPGDLIRSAAEGGLTLAEAFDAFGGMDGIGIDDAVTAIIGGLRHALADHAPSEAGKLAKGCMLAYGLDPAAVWSVSTHRDPKSMDAMAEALGIPPRFRHAPIDHSLSGPIQELLPGMWWARTLHIKECYLLERLPDRMRVGDSLAIEDCRHLSALGTGMVIGQKCVIGEGLPMLTSLPKAMVVKGDLDMSKWRKWDGKLPEDLFVGGTVTLPDKAHGVPLAALRAAARLVGTKMGMRAIRTEWETILAAGCSIGAASERIVESVDAETLIRWSMEAGGEAGLRSSMVALLMQARKAGAWGKVSEAVVKAGAHPLSIAAAVSRRDLIHGGYRLSVAGLALAERIRKTIGLERWEGKTGSYDGNQTSALGFTINSATDQETDRPVPELVIRNLDPILAMGRPDLPIMFEGCVEIACGWNPLMPPVRCTGAIKVRSASSDDFARLPKGSSFTHIQGEPSGAPSAKPMTPFASELAKVMPVSGARARRLTFDQYEALAKRLGWWD